MTKKYIYDVLIPIQGHLTIQLAADSQEEAERLALQDFEHSGDEAGDLEYFHKLEQIKATRIGRVADRPPHRR